MKRLALILFVALASLAVAQDPALPDGVKCMAGRCHEKDCLCHTDGNPCESARTPVDDFCKLPKA